MSDRNGNFQFLPQNPNVWTSNGQTQQTQQQNVLPIPELSQNWTNPLLTASAGSLADGTSNNMGGLALQDFLNRNNQNATNALYGGLMNYQPQSMKVGSANADYAYNSTPPTSDPQGLLGLLSQGFGNRSWNKG